MAELRNTPVQDRSSARLQSLRQASLNVLERTGRDGFNTRDIAEEADSSIGTVYRYYAKAENALDDIWPERDSILDTVVEILSRPLPAVTASREKDRERLMLEARARIELSRPMLPEAREALRARLMPEEHLDAE